MRVPLSKQITPTPDPLVLLERVATLPHPVLLDGAADPNDLGRWSFLSWDPLDLIEASAESWPEVAQRLRNSCNQAPRAPDSPPFEGGWVGWLSYELGRAFDRQPIAAVDRLRVSDVSLGLYDVVIAWDHHSNSCWLISTGIDRNGIADERRAADRLEEFVAIVSDCDAVADPGAATKRPSQNQTIPNMTRDEYIDAVGQVKEHVRSGDIFQANLTQRFNTSFSDDRIALYRRLRKNAAGSHAAFIDRGRVAVLSMSPERFIRFDAASGEIEARPIKGTRPRDADADRDRQLAAELSASAKDRAENVMIVDLLRNDISKVAIPGSVSVEALCRLESYAAVHHLVSVISASIADGGDAVDLIEATFPGGSITGAPKLRAMEILAGLERETRGVYCGGIGWLGLDGSLDLNIGIRTVTLADGIASLGAGGGVTLLSDPESEYREACDKAEALIEAVGGSLP